MHSRKTLRHRSPLALLVYILLLPAIVAASPKKLFQHDKTLAVVGHGEQDAHAAVTRGAETLTFAAALACAKRRGSVIPVAHRGRADDSWPENSATGIAAALRSGAHFIELDIRKTQDDVLFLHHDETLERTTSRSGLAASATWSELSASLLKHHDGRTATEHPIRLLDALSIAPSDTYFLLDIKDSSAVKAVVTETINAGWHDRAAFIAYSIDQAETVREILPNALIALGANHRDRMRSIDQSNLDLPIIGLMGSVATPDAELLRFADSKGYFVLGGTYVGNPSLEEILSSEGYGDDMVRLRAGFTLWVTNQFPRIAEYLDYLDQRLEFDSCAE